MKPTRAFWSGTITFGLVSIPVDLYAAVRGRQTAMKMVDAEGAPLGREYYSDKTQDALGPDDLVRGYETEKGATITVSDEELDAIAPELTRDIEMRVFVRQEEIPPACYDRPYVLVPSGGSAKAYRLLAQTLQQAGYVGVGTFVMRGHQRLVAIMSDGQLLRAETLRFADEIRSPHAAGLPKAAKPAEKDVKAMARAIKALEKDALDMDELSDRYAAELHKLAEGKQKKHEDVVELEAPAAEEAEGDAGNVVDLMKLLRERVGAKPAAHRGAHRPAHHKRARAA